ncbi:hypothetical protein MNBD_ALPHA09-93 [hydrothermal vent metagenome]|uniref:Uncharacterized protein n=1 Tax=hydrothermal vent metagenome TaxID=652676 RepID=A0A3B0U773_9ZZZZ
MIKAALLGALITTGLALAVPAPAQAGNAGFGVQFGQGLGGPSIDIHFRRYRQGVGPRQIRRTVRRYGCYNISPVRRVGKRYKVVATCDNGTRVKMVFSARSGRLLRERIIGYERRGQRHRWGKDYFQRKFRRDFYWRH